MGQQNNAIAKVTIEALPVLPNDWPNTHPPHKPSTEPNIINTRLEDDFLITL